MSTHILHDLSPPLSAALAVWPGDVPFSREITSSTQEGGSYDASAIRTTLHVGSHVDAPRHYLPGGASVDEMVLSTFLGPCRVVDVRPGEGRVRLRDLLGPQSEPFTDSNLDVSRLLLRTGTWTDPSRFPEKIRGLDPELITWLSDRKVRLIGVDSPSVDPFDDLQLHAHKRSGACGVAILEGLCLDGVMAGRYTLVALPLRILHGDGSPVRAVLLPESWALDD